MMNLNVNAKLPEQNQTKAQSRSERVNTISASKEKEVMGGRDLGQVLNEIADKNYVDPSKVRKPESKMDKDAFLKLMLTQLKYQDPMNPMESHQMASQLAQFSSLEQLSNINDSVKGLKKSQDPVTNYQALNFIGKTVSADTEKVIRNKGDTAHDLRFQLPQNATEVTVKIKDDAGEVVKTLKATNLRSGENKITWNGTKEDGFPSFAGNYTFSVEGVTEGGGKVVGLTNFSGTVTGLNYSAEGPILMIGDQKVRLSDVNKIEDENEKMAQEIRDQMKNVIGGGSQGKMFSMNGDGEKGAPAQEAPKDMKSNIDFVPMSNDLRNKVLKEIDKKG